MDRRTAILAGGLLSMAGSANSQTPAPSGSLEAVVHEIRDRIVILETKYAYCRHADALDAEGMLALVTDDCVVNYFGADEAQTMRGKAALRAMLTAYLPNTISSSHHISNSEVQFDGQNRAVLHCYMYSWQRFRGYPGLADCHRWGRYEDQFVRTSEGWRMSHVRLLSHGEYGATRIGEQFDRPFPPRFE
jgi:ketosteroid isomerase-like protein